MEQNSYNIALEIAGVLLKGPNHSRCVARTLVTNHMSVSRKMREMLEANVLDYREEGRNKVFFLKNTAEARSCAVMAESYMLVKALKKHPELRKIVESIQADKRIMLAVIFGSYAKGNVKKGSDIDLYIETRDAGIKRDVEKLDSRLSVKTGLYDKESMLIREIEKSHIIIKGIEEFYGKAGIFGQAR
ncbi:MAG: nucleotidyltransferase domain-containing protein [Candidatus Aenigmarchaeota archaeon]|nr:nucleotidyltransferase domain-containing protein [Candidatus Aenigmarchaeota archaeon]